MKSLRRQLLDKRLALTTINSSISVVRQLFYWGCEEEIVPAEVAGALRTVQMLHSGQSSAIEYAAVEPVAAAIVEKTLLYLDPVVQDMVKVQRLICGRPQDVFNMRFCDIDRTGDVWRYIPFTHKTKHRGKKRELPIGPKAQQILSKYFDQCGNALERFVFATPAGAQHTNHSYLRNIKTACKKAGVPVWTPNQLRHDGAAEVRDKYGLDYAQAVLGHANAKTTEIYAKVSFDKAAAVAREIG